MTKIINIDEIDIEEARAAINARYNFWAKTVQWTPQRVQLHVMDDLIAASMIGLTLGTQSVTIQIDSYSSMNREAINELMDLEIIYMGRRHVFETMSVDKEIGGDEYGDGTPIARAWLDVTYRRAA